jgi:hypothetical protein
LLFRRSALPLRLFRFELSKQLLAAPYVFKTLPFVSVRHRINNPTSIFPRHSRRAVPPFVNPALVVLQERQSPLFAMPAAELNVANRDERFVPVTSTH